jgi:hypothetical protein
MITFMANMLKDAHRLAAKTALVKTLPKSLRLLTFVSVDFLVLLPRWPRCPLLVGHLHLPLTSW